MKLSELVKKFNLQHYAIRPCTDGLAQYVGGEKLSTVITKNGVIIKILDDHANLSPLLS